MLRRRCIGHGSLLKFPSTRAAFARPGPGACPVPRLLAPMQPSDSLVAVGRGSGSPCARPTSRRTLLLGPRARARASADARASESGHRVPVAPVLREEWEGLPGSWVVLFPVPWSSTPPDVRSPRPLHAVTTLLPSDFVTSSASGMSSFRGCILHGPLARVPTHRPRVAPDGARLATGRPGSAFTGRIRTRWTTNRILEVIAPPFLRPALPGRTTK